MQIQKIDWHPGTLDIRTLLSLADPGHTVLHAGIASFAKGQRHPAQGLTAHDLIEVSVILEGAFDVETPTGVVRVDENSLVMIPIGEPHATMPLADARVFYVLFGPQQD